MKRKLVLICLIISVLFGFAACGIQQPTVLTINGDNVSLSEFNYYFSTAKLQAESAIPADQIDMYWETEKDGKTMFELLKDSAYEEMVALRVAANKAEAMGIKYTDNDVMQATNGFKNQIIQTASSEKEYYEMTNTDSDTITEIAKLYAIRSAMLSRFIEDGTLNISDDVLKATFNEKWMKAQHILVSLVNNETGEQLTDEQKAEKKALAESLLERVKKGEDFTALMNEYSDDPGKEYEPEGYIFTSGEMVTEFEDAVKALGANEVSGIVESSYGYHIIKRLPLSAEADAEKFEENKEYVETEIIIAFLDENVPLWKEEMEIIEYREPIANIKK